MRKNKISENEAADSKLEPAAPTGTATVESSEAVSIMPAPEVADKESEVDKDATSVVIVSQPGHEKETLLALRSFMTFLSGCLKFILIGSDLPDEYLKELDDKVVNIPFDFSGNVAEDNIEMMRLLIGADEVSDQFVFVPPRCWLVSRIGLQHIQVDKYIGLLDDTIKKVPSLSGALSATRTFFMADGYPYPLLDFNTGYPVYLAKINVVDALAHIDDSGEVLEFFSVYGNILRGMSHPIKCRLDDEWGLNVKAANIPEAIFAEHIVHKCFLRTELDDMPVMIETFINGMINDVSNIVPASSL